jgi:hypothetical protein
MQAAKEYYKAAEGATTLTKPNRLAAENTGRPDKAVSPTYFNT